LSSRTVYCTILARNYLPRALTLAESLRRHEDGAQLRILCIDVPDEEELPRLPGVECLSTARLDLSRRELLHTATIYDLVELATAVKPLLLKALLDEADQVVYLDPDTYVLSPMVELSPALQGSEGGILLTPHFLASPPPTAEYGDGHMLFVGVYNLGFCAVDQRARSFLDWWWGHLRTECLYDPLVGLFVDQKWMDMGSVLFQATAFRHSGYNVGVGNLLERPLGQDAEGYYNVANGERLRLFHFHAFDSATPEKLSTRFRNANDQHAMQDDPLVLQLCKEYASVLSSFEQAMPEAPPYPYATDTRGRKLSRLLRRAYRGQALAAGGGLPSPFVPSEAAAFDAWRRRAWRPVTRTVLGDAATSLRLALPEQYDSVKARFPALVAKLRARHFKGGGMWN
jgi:hypothetical protein